jgi:hypothetical protein
MSRIPGPGHELGLQAAAMKRRFLTYSSPAARLVVKRGR